MKKTVLLHLLVFLLCTACVANKPNREVGMPDATQEDAVTREAPAADYGLFVETNVEGALVIVEGLGEAYHDGMRVPAGDYFVEVIKEGYNTWREKVSVVDADVMLTAKLVKRPRKGNKLALTVRTDPPEARVRIMNIVPKYKDGILLTPGRYLIEVSHKGYREYEEWITVKGEDHLLNVRLKAKNAAPSLLVKAVPGKARVRILNIEEPYRDNMPLRKGKYLVEVALDGYETVQKWISIADKDLVMTVKLEKE